MSKLPHHDDDAHYVRLYGRWNIKHHSPNQMGAMELVREIDGINIITTNGKEALASLLYSGTVTATTNTFKYMAIGTGAGAESAAGTTLGTEAARHTGTVSYVSGAIYQVSATFATGIGTGAIVEYGLFNSSSAGTMFSRDLENVINKGASDTLTATLQITLS